MWSDCIRKISMVSMGDTGTFRVTGVYSFIKCFTKSTYCSPAFDDLISFSLQPIQQPLLGVNNGSAFFLPSSYHTMPFISGIQSGTLLARESVKCGSQSISCCDLEGRIRARWKQTTVPASSPSCSQKENEKQNPAQGAPR